MQENVARQEDSGLGQGRERLFPSLCLDELELFLVKKLLSGGRLRALSALNRDRFLPRPSPPDPARVLACEDANSKLIEVFTVANAADEDRVGNSLLKIWS